MLQTRAVFVKLQLGSFVNVGLIVHHEFI